MKIASNLPDVFTNYKGVTKSLNHAVNASCRVEIPIKPLHPRKVGGLVSRKMFLASVRRLREKHLPQKKVNASQPKVDRHQVDMINPRPNPHMHTIEQAEGSEDSDSLILGNHDEFHRVQEIFINYTSFGELFDRNTMVVNSCFSTMVADLLNNPDPKIMAKCKQRSDWIKWKEAIETEIDSLRK
jgi:hypothetical protein